MHTHIPTTRWTDTAGQERFRTIAKSYMKNANVIIIVFDVTRRESMLGCDHWVKDMVENNPKDCVAVAVGNKIDRADLREVSTEEARSHFESMNPSLRYFETSALTGEGVNELFETVVRMAMEGTSVLCCNDNTDDSRDAQPRKDNKCIIC